MRICEKADLWIYRAMHPPFHAFTHPRFYASYSAFRLFLAASIVLSRSALVCARDRNAASNCEGAMFTPFLSMPRKYFPNRAVSESLALSKSFTFLSVKKQVNIEP